jgi:hypothetical protein
MQYRIVIRLTNKKNLILSSPVLFYTVDSSNKCNSKLLV